MFRKILSILFILILSGQAWGAGSDAVPTRATSDIGTTMRAEVFVTVSYTSDDTNGTVPDETLDGLRGYYLSEVYPVPDAESPATSAFEVRIENADGAAVFLSGSIAVDSKSPIAGYEGHPAGHYPRMDSSMTLKLVDPSDHTTAADIGNSKLLVLKLRFEQR